MIPGSVPSPLELPQGCVFAPRCPYATERCHTQKPPLVQTAPDHKVSCFRYLEKEGD